VNESLLGRGLWLEAHIFGGIEVMCMKLSVRRPGRRSKFEFQKTQRTEISAVLWLHILGRLGVHKNQEAHLHTPKSRDKHPPTDLMAILAPWCL
jgi:hypothetical protein